MTKTGTSVRAIALAEHRDLFLAYTVDLTLPFDNNAAEVRHEVARDEWIHRKAGRLMMSAV